MGVAVAVGGGGFVRFFVREGLAGVVAVAAVGVAVADEGEACAACAAGAFGFEASVERLRDARGTLRERPLNVPCRSVSARHAPRSIRPSAIDRKPQSFKGVPLARTVAESSLQAS